MCDSSEHESALRPAVFLLGLREQEQLLLEVLLQEQEERKWVPWTLWEEEALTL